MEGIRGGEGEVCVEERARRVVRFMECKCFCVLC